MGIVKTNTVEHETHLHSSIEVQPELLLTTLHGIVSFNAVWHVFEQTYDIARGNRLHLILIDALAMEGKLTTFERYRLATKTENYFRLRQFHPTIAVVGKPPSVDSFAALVGKNRWVTVEVFSNHAQALNWLTSRKKPEPLDSSPKP